MMETVLVLPLVFVVLALLFFFGQAMTRLQRSSVTDRYEAWRQTQYAPGPGAEFGKYPAEFGDANLLDEAFFAGNASDLSIADRTGRIRVTEPMQLIADAATNTAFPSDTPAYDPQAAGDLADARHARSPAWWRVDLATEHTSDVPFYQRFAGPVHHQHTVIDGDWSYGSWIEQAHRGERDELEDALDNDVHFIGDRGDPHPDLDELHVHGIAGVYETFFTDFDPALREIHEENDNPIAGSIRFIYLRSNGYRGPQVYPNLAPIGLWYRPDDNPDPGDPLD